MSAVIAISWLATGLANLGFVYAYFQREYPELADKERRRDTIFSAIGVLFGPIGIPATLISGTYGHGWLFPGSKP